MPPGKYISRRSRQALSRVNFDINPLYNIFYLHSNLQTMRRAHCNSQMATNSIPYLTHGVQSMRFHGCLGCKISLQNGYRMNGASGLGTAEIFLYENRTRNYLKKFTINFKLIYELMIIYLKLFI